MSSGRSCEACEVSEIEDDFANITLPSIDVWGAIQKAVEIPIDEDDCTSASVLSIEDDGATRKARETFNAEEDSASTTLPSADVVKNPECLTVAKSNVTEDKISATSLDFFPAYSCDDIFEASDAEGNEISAISLDFFPDHRWEDIFETSVANEPIGDLISTVPHDYFSEYCCEDIFDTASESKELSNIHEVTCPCPLFLVPSVAEPMSESECDSPVSEYYVESSHADPVYSKTFQTRRLHQGKHNSYATETHIRPGCARHWVSARHVETTETRVRPGLSRHRVSSPNSCLAQP